MEKKGLRVNAGKTKIMICGTGQDLLQSSGEFPCAVCCTGVGSSSIYNSCKHWVHKKCSGLKCLTKDPNYRCTRCQGTSHPLVSRPQKEVQVGPVCRTGVGSNSIFCNGCKHWVHKKCSGLKPLKKDLDYRCTRCQGTARPLDGRPQKEVQVGPDKLEVVASFCYLGDMLSAAGGCELSTCVKTTWKKFKDLLQVLSSRHLSFKTCGHVYSSCVQSSMLVRLGH